MKLEQIKNKVEGSALSLATVDSENKPHCVAVGFAKVVDGKIVITDNYMAKTPKNIANNSNIALTFYSRNWEEDCWGFEIRGTAEYHTEGKWRDFVKGLEGNEGMPAKGAIIVTVETIKKLA